MGGLLRRWRAARTFGWAAVLFLTLLLWSILFQVHPVFAASNDAGNGHITRTMEPTRASLIPKIKSALYALHWFQPKTIEGAHCFNNEFEGHINIRFRQYHIFFFALVVVSIFLALVLPRIARFRAKNLDQDAFVNERKENNPFVDFVIGGNERSQKWIGWLENLFTRMRKKLNPSDVTRGIPSAYPPVGVKGIPSVSFINYPESMAITTLRDGRFIDANESFEALTGYSRSDLLGKTVQQVKLWLHVDDRDWMIEQLLSRHQVIDLEEKIRIRSGEIRYVLVSGRTISIHGEDCILMILRDITEKKLNEERSRIQMQRLATLRVVDMTIAASMDLDQVLNILLEKIINELKVDSCLLLLLNSDQHLVYRAVKGIKNEAIKQTCVKVGEKYAGWVALTCKPVYLLQNAENPNPFLSRSDIAQAGYIAYYCTPLIAKGRVLGVVEIFNRKPLPSDPDWISFFEALADQAAIAIDNASLMEMVEKTNQELIAAYDATIQGWAHALELRDVVTEGHSQRVLNLTLLIAREMGFQENDLVHFQRGALLHDIGKMAVPDAILFKAGPLLPEEWKIMRKHPQYAYELLSGVPFLKPSLDIPYCHHERWDGSGYPRGLKGEEIPLAARIFAVVDVWDALLSDRPYRDAWDEERAKKYIQQNAGILFDPVVVEVFLKQLIAPDLPNKSQPK